jgi:hypothetical protein
VPLQSISDLSSTSSVNALCHIESEEGAVAANKRHGEDVGLSNVALALLERKSAVGAYALCRAENVTRERVNKDVKAAALRRCGNLPGKYSRLRTEYSLAPHPPLIGVERSLGVRADSGVYLLLALPSSAPVQQPSVIYKEIGHW